MKSRGSRVSPFRSWRVRVWSSVGRKVACMRAATVVVMSAGGGEVDSAEEGEGLRIDWRLSRRSLMTST